LSCCIYSVCSGAKKIFFKNSVHQWCPPICFYTFSYRLDEYSSKAGVSRHPKVMEVLSCVTVIFSMDHNSTFYRRPLVIPVFWIFFGYFKNHINTNFFSLEIVTKKFVFKSGSPRVTYDNKI